MTNTQKSFHFDKQSRERLDVYITSCLADFSRSRIQGLIREGFAKVNGVVVMKTGQTLEDGDEIEILIPAAIPSTLAAEKIPLDIIFENDDLLVVNKPAGMVVHPSPGHDRGTLVNAALGHIPFLEGIGGVERPGIVHRLDKDTSGLILIAKNERSHRWFQNQFRNRSVEKVYLALVDGNPPTPKGRVEAPIGRNTTHRKLMAVVTLEKGREAVTEYRMVETFQKHTLLEVHPLTGRTHQIRVHMAFLGCPVAGDVVYGRRVPTVKVNRHFLHALRLKIKLPGEKHTVTFEAPLPSELLSLLEGLRTQED